MRGTNEYFKINSRAPSSDRIQRSYSLEPVKYESLTENHKYTLTLQGFKETWNIKLYDWIAADITAFNLIETKTLRNICTFQETLDKAATKQCYFEYYIDPFERVLNIKLTSVQLLNYASLASDIAYTKPSVLLGNTITESDVILGGITLPDRSTIKIDVDYNQDADKISITGKIHRGYKYYADGTIYKKISFKGFAICDNTLYADLFPLQATSQELNVFGFTYDVIPIINFKQILADTWTAEYSLEVE